MNGQEDIPWVVVGKHPYRTVEMGKSVHFLHPDHDISPPLNIVGKVYHVDVLEDETIIHIRTSTLQCDPFIKLAIRSDWFTHPQGSEDQDPRIWNKAIHARGPTWETQPPSLARITSIDHDTTDEKGEYVNTTGGADAAF